MRRWFLATTVATSSAATGSGVGWLAALVRVFSLALVVAGVTGAGAQLPVARVEGLAAVIGGHYPGPGVDVVLRSDVELRARLRMAEQQAVAEDGAPSPALLAASLHELVGEVLIARESKRVQVGTLGPEEVERERRRIADRVGGSAELAAVLAQVGASASEIEAMAERRALVALFLSANLEGFQEVTAAEVDAALVAEGELEPRDVPRERRIAVRRELVRAASRRAVERWTRVLEARSVVRVYADYGSEDDV